MARVRFILVDNTTGRVFSGVQKVQDATAINVIGGKVPQIRTVTNSGTVVTLKRAATFGLSTSGGFITNISIKLGAAPQVSGLTITYRVGSTYETSTTFASTTIAVGVKVASIPVAVSVAGDQSIFIDVAYVTSSGRSASKLQTTLTYYAVAQ